MSKRRLLNNVIIMLYKVTREDMCVHIHNNIKLLTFVIYKQRPGISSQLFFKGTFFFTSFQIDEFSF